ncbi:putative pectinesterase 68 [Capsicum annuum]|uniref:Pectinesterase n=2 Tax=Capsicum annuum TaxID=4072 RepID=A0A2G3AEQ5_CAPAN|nr:putative pectinesterase 68 [Capsicum annuum]
MQGWQAVAFRISGDKAYFSGCGFYGAQDTLCDDAGRHYFKECYIEGSIDFIFGNGRSMYKACELHSIATRFGSIAAQDRRSSDEKTGFAFLGCRVTGSGPLYVGRAMGQYSRIVYSYTYFDDVVAHGGWDDWDHVSNKNKTAFFGVYKCSGPGAAAVKGLSWARELNYDTAHKFLAKSFVNGRHWIAPSDA